jgi:hypothetical protein
MKAIKDINLAAVCGIYCGNCDYLSKDCDGCKSREGKPFWTNLYNIAVCPLYDCCHNQKQLEHCGLCPDFPCSTFLSLKDPSMSEEEANRALSERQKELIIRRDIGTDEWLKTKA